MIGTPAARALFYALHIAAYLVVSAGAVRNAAGGLAGSVALLDECVARMESCGAASADEARRAASKTPRRLLTSA